MKYTAEMGSVAKFRKDWFRHSKIYGGGIQRHTDRMEITFRKVG
jgi:hypothetical protein